MEQISTTEKVLNKYMLAALTIWVCSLALCSPQTPWYQVTLGAMFMHVWVYWVHRATHLLPKEGLIAFLNTHIRFHHEFDKPVSRELELFFEVIFDLSMNFSLLLIEWLIGYYIIPIPVIILFGLSYTSIHLINYSIVGNIVHKRHHLTYDKNFGPDVSDHIFGTNFNDELEDLNYLSLNVIWMTFVLYSIRKMFW